MRYNVGDVVWVANFDFSGSLGTKTAPGVILSSHKYHSERPDAIVARVTSQMHHASGFSAVVIHDWSACGLDKPSVIKPILMTVEQRQIIRVAGKIDQKTLTLLKRAFKDIFPFSN